jgi:hypothetical protein
LKEDFEAGTYTKFPNGQRLRFVFAADDDYNEENSSLSVQPIDKEHTEIFNSSVVAYISHLNTQVR